MKLLIKVGNLEEMVQEITKKKKKTCSWTFQIPLKQSKPGHRYRIFKLKPVIKMILTAVD